ncbi:MAG: sugar phosphate isomerase/epimerase [Clostridia bacterium]|nr:sugar phosphate isomerase/epimerase [Clostridia bacterium]
MKRIKIASPLYIIREECAKDLAGVLKKLAEIGYDGIEFLGFFGHSAAEVKAMLEENGLEALGNHVPYAELVADADGIFDFHKAVGCSYLTVADLPLDGFDTVSANLKVISEKAALRGIRLLYHNHDQELIEKTDGEENLTWIMEHTDLFLEPDLGWIEIGGGDPAAYLEKYVSRCPVIHLKDYFTTDHAKLGRVRDFVPARGGEERGHFEFRPTGYGVLNVPKLMPLCLACDPEWFVMDHDLAYERDSFDDLKLSLDYTRNLLAIQK